MTKNTWYHYIDGKSSPYEFKTYKVYYAYKWWQAESIDNYNKITPIKTKTGYEIQESNYKSKYIKI